MIEGITILNQTEIMDLPGWCVLGTSVCILLAVFLLSLGGIIRSVETVIAGLLALVVALFLLLFGGIGMVGTGRYEYEVIIDESVDFIDIYENYDVIEQRGDIWVIEDKEID